MDNSPAGCRLRQRDCRRGAGPYERADTNIITDPSQRPSDGEYDRYLWLLEEMKSVRYDDARCRGDEFRGGGRLRLGDLPSRARCWPTSARRQAAQRRRPRTLRWADRFRTGVAATTDERTGAAKDYDLRARRPGSRPRRWPSSLAALRRTAARSGACPAQNCWRAAVLRSPRSAVPL